MKTVWRHIVRILDDLAFILLGVFLAFLIFLIGYLASRAMGG